MRVRIIPIDGGYSANSYLASGAAHNDGFGKASHRKYLPVPRTTTVMRDAYQIVHLNRPVAHSASFTHSKM
mgnify:CR=1 FL=1